MTRRLRARTVAAALALAAGLVTPGIAPAVPDSDDIGVDRPAAPAAERPDPRRTRGLFVDPLMPAANQERVYATAFGRRSQALWITPEHYPTPVVRDIVRAYTGRALAADKTPVLTVYGIPDRDCGLYSSGGLPGGDAYRDWIRQVARGTRGQQALVVLEPDAIPFYGDPRCTNAGDRLKLLRFASRVLSRSGAWVYLDAGHSDWRPFDGRPRLLKRAGIGFARGFSTNVSNFRPTADEHDYAGFLRRELRKLKVKGVHYVIDTSRNGHPDPVGGDVLNPVWARVGKAPRLVFDGAFDGTLWVKHPGESDGEVNGGPGSGQWCDFLADRLLDRRESPTCD
ncbi:glycoside hydrolase family 6 protein [Nocardioides ferulae]|uniref:glycoside hydrolase family 6 protein n=1 Tax=Nocardioides ferulae TaxID=2340821 RepID=UPI000EB47B5A|nr:glycoside hydrolase family 6 protein [Nocardioides ferulae]